MASSVLAPVRSCVSHCVPSWGKFKKWALLAGARCVTNLIIWNYEGKWDIPESSYFTNDGDTIYLMIWREATICFQDLHQDEHLSTNGAHNHVSCQIYL